MVITEEVQAKANEVVEAALNRLKYVDLGAESSKIVLEAATFTLMQKVGQSGYFPAKNLSLQNLAMQLIRELRQEVTQVNIDRVVNLLIRMADQGAFIDHLAEEGVK
mgnify:CR=1 FL=1